MTQPLPHVEELVRRAAELAGEQRAAFLERECVDPELRARVVEHLCRLEAAGTFVEPLAEPDGSALEGHCRALGPTHEYTLGSMLNLSDLLGQLGRLEEAEAMAREAAEGFERTQGSEKPVTLLALANHAMLQSRLGCSEEAERQMLRVLEARERLLGERHSETWSTG